MLIYLKLDMRIEKKKARKENVKQQGKNDKNRLESPSIRSPFQDPFLC